MIVALVVIYHSSLSFPDTSSYSDTLALSPDNTFHPLPPSASPPPFLSPPVAPCMPALSIGFKASTSIVHAEDRPIGATTGYRVALNPLPSLRLLQVQTVDPHQAPSSISQHHPKRAPQASHQIPSSPIKPIKPHQTPLMLPL